MVESRRQNAMIHEMDPVTEVEFPSASEAGDRAPDQSSTDLLANLQLVWDKRRSLYRVALWALAISTVIAFLIPNQYESSASIMPPDSMNNAGSMLAALVGGKASSGSDLMSMAGSVLGMKNTGALFVEVLRSRSVQERVVDRLNLQSVYWKRYKEDARKKLDSRTDVSEDRKSGVILLTVQDRSPQRAHDIAQAYVEELNRLMAQVSTSSARRERIFIEQRLITVKSDLEDAEKQFAGFASKNSTLDIKEQTKAMVESAAVLQAQMIASESELQSLEQIYTGNNVRVRAARARVDELKRQLQNLQGTDASLASDATGPDQSYPSIRKLPLLGVEWVDLYRRMKIQEKVYELLTQQYELARIQEAKEVPTANLVDSANVPEKKSFPPRLLIIVALTILSVAGAAVWMVKSEHWQQVDPQDPGKAFAESVWRETSRHLGTWFAAALTRLRLSRMLRRNMPESPE
jgi:capsule polysaccharide export protein KpsE/RkpR